MFSGQNNSFPYSNQVYTESVDHVKNYSSSASFSSTIEINNMSLSCQQYQERTKNDIDHLIHQFGNYFRRKLNQNLQHFIDANLSTIDELEIHVKRIVNATGNYDMKQGYPIHGVSSSSDDSLFKQDDAASNDPPYTENFENDAKICEETKERYLIRLLTLSAMISSNLY